MFRYSEYARIHGIDLDDLKNTPEDTDWPAFCREMVSYLNKDDTETRECAREWSDSGSYDKSSGSAASMLWRKITAKS